MIVCFEGSRHIMWRLFVCLERKTEAKKSNTCCTCTKKYMPRQGWSLSIRWAMPWPMVACQEVPNGISSTEGKNINHLRRDKLSKNNQSYMCTFNENEFLRLSKGG